jgi:hypothetical protein
MKEISFDKPGFGWKRSPFLLPKENPASDSPTNARATHAISNALSFLPLQPFFKLSEKPLWPVVIKSLSI